MSGLMHNSYVAEGIKHLTYKIAPGIKVLAVSADNAVAGTNAFLEVNGATMRLFWDDREIAQTKGDPQAMTKAIEKPILALRKVYEDGIEEGKKRALSDELHALKEKQENAYRSLRHRAMAAAWSAFARAASV